MTSIDYLRRNGQPNHSEQIDNINIYDLASTVNRKGNGVDSLDTPNAINAPGQIQPDGQDPVKLIQGLNPDAGTIPEAEDNVYEGVIVPPQPSSAIRVIKLDVDNI